MILLLHRRRRPNEQLIVFDQKCIVNKRQEHMTREVANGARFWLGHRTRQREADNAGHLVVRK